jgi:hypothetical protein
VDIYLLTGTKNPASAPPIRTKFIVSSVRSARKIFPENPGTGIFFHEKTIQAFVIFIKKKTKIPALGCFFHKKKKKFQVSEIFIKKKIKIPAQ